MGKVHKIIIGSALILSLAAVPAMAYAMPGQRGQMPQDQQGQVGPRNRMEFNTENGEMPQLPPDQSDTQMQGENFMGRGQQDRMGQFGQMNTQAQTASEPGEIVYSDLASNSAEELEADYANATTIVMSESDNTVKIKSSGTYIITGSASDGYIQVNKGVQDVVLVLQNLTLTSTSQATLSVNKGAEAKIIVLDNVTLTDAETDTESDDYDGAVIKAKAGSSVVLTGTGTLNINGNSRHGIKVSDTDADDVNDGYGDASFIIDGGITVNVTAAEDGMNSGTDLTIKSGTINVSAGDDGIKADYILTIGEEGESGPTIKVTKSNEGLEGATVNILSGNINVTASDDGINAANGDLSDYTYSLNILGGSSTVSSGADGIDSNGNINLIAGSLTIAKSASNGGEGGIDYEGSYYISDEFKLDNPYGITMDSGMGGMGGQRGQMDGQSGSTQKGNRMQNGLQNDVQDNTQQNTQPNFFQRIINFFRR